MNATTHHANDKEFANRCRAARGWASFQEWRDANRREAASFQSRLSSKKENKERLRELIRLLDSDFETLIRPNL
jgi:hypothetical protein